MEGEHTCSASKNTETRLLFSGVYPFFFAFSLQEGRQMCSKASALLFSAIYFMLLLNYTISITAYLFMEV